jgi:hypothetical protein
MWHGRQTSAYGSPRAVDAVRHVCVKLTRQGGTRVVTCNVADLHRQAAQLLSWHYMHPHKRCQESAVHPRRRCSRPGLEGEPTCMMSATVQPLLRRCYRLCPPQSVRTGPWQAMGEATDRLTTRLCRAHRTQARESLMSHSSQRSWMSVEKGPDRAWAAAARCDMCAVIIYLPLNAHTTPPRHNRSQQSCPAQAGAINPPGRCARFI